MGVIVLHRSRDWKDFLCVSVYVCMCVRVCVCIYMCDHTTGRNIYPIATKVGTQVGLVKNKVKFEDEICGSHRDTYRAAPKN